MKAGEFTKEVHAWLALETKSFLHYRQQGDINTACGKHAEWVKHTPAKDFVNCPKCISGSKKPLPKEA